MNANPKTTHFLFPSNQDPFAQTPANEEKPRHVKSFPTSFVRLKGDRYKWISEAAYFRAEARAFDAGNELSDWLDAEKDYDAELMTAFLSECEEDGGLTDKSVLQLAGLMGIEDPEAAGNKTDLIRAIQKAAHQRPCFRSGINSSCLQQDCKWKMECRKLIAEWMR